MSIFLAPLHTCPPFFSTYFTSATLSFLAVLEFAFVNFYHLKIYFKTYLQITNRLKLLSHKFIFWNCPIIVYMVAGMLFIWGARLWLIMVCHKLQPTHYKRLLCKCIKRLVRDSWHCFSEGALVNEVRYYCFVIWSIIFRAVYLIHCSDLQFLWLGRVECKPNDFLRPNSPF